VCVLQFIDTNNEYTAYGEWKSWQDFMEHVESAEVGDWVEFLAKVSSDFFY